jgi:DNA mismatch repair protein MutS
MAQMGSFVPAREASIGVTDRIFCRVGASDNLARGESTFLVEMNETANILRSATDRSLVIMDEVGRGTGTSDGLAIAWAVCEELLNRTLSRTLFATHYHELSLISHPRLANRSMEVLERNGEIVFLRKLREGPAAESYGLHVAALAGLPGRVLDRAGELLVKLRTGETSPRKILPGPESETVAGPEIADSGGETGNAAFPPVADTAPGAGLFRELETLNPDGITPIEALEILYRWKDLFVNGISRQDFQARNPPGRAAFTRRPSDPKIRRNPVNGETRPPKDSAPSLFDGL